MERLKLIRSLCLLSALVIGVLPSIVNAQAMRTLILGLSDFPTTDKYCDGTYPRASFTLPTDHTTNMHLCSPITVSSVPENVVDWILVELRTIANGGTDGSTAAINASTVIARKPAFLLSNGRIVDAEAYSSGVSDGTLSLCNTTSNNADDNCPDVLFDQGNVASSIDNADLYLVIRHRSHLDIISSTRITESSGAYLYDFSMGTNTAREPGRGGLKTKEGPISKVSVPVMYGGDADGDNSIGFSDFTDGIAPVEDQQGYFNGDFNMDRIVGFSDYTETIAINEGTRAAQPIR